MVLQDYVKFVVKAPPVFCTLPSNPIQVCHVMLCNPLQDRVLCQYLLFILILPEIVEIQNAEFYVVTICVRKRD